LGGCANFLLSSQNLPSSILLIHHIQRNIFIQHYSIGVSFCFLFGRLEVSTNSTYDYFTAEMNMPSPTLIEHLTQLIRASLMTPSNPIFFTG